MAIDVKKIEKLFSSRSSWTLFKEALIDILTEKDSRSSILVFGIISIIPAGLIGVSKDTVELTYKAVSNLNSIILALFAIVFTGYALFQALVNNDLLRRLLIADAKKSRKVSGDDNAGRSKLQESNEYFIKLMMSIISAIVINVLLLLVIGSLPKDFCLPLNNTINNTMAAILIWIYFLYMFRILWEMKSFVYNMFQLFNAHAGSKAIELLKKQDEE
ncbi:hypothetical protein AAFJ72_03500 [Brevibacillus gelatini]|uniref:hypothetical protein n=1 Tax=Brevibacillus gelatini TaxID=1655277 RepID=UPI003D81A690